ncbi:MAG TPA: hypothetical protein PKH75_13105, partial [Bacillota bacterium]|nr:hypothetical protein [Bacillota bacterium]HOK71720.1 hypothetical protein [Bacillota bacterium]
VSKFRGVDCLRARDASQALGRDCSHAGERRRKRCRMKGLIKYEVGVLRYFNETKQRRFASGHTC